MTRRCPACGGAANGRVLPVSEAMFGLGESFDYLPCPECGSLYIASIPDHLADYYSTEYYSFEVDPDRQLGRFPASALVRAIGRSVLFGRGRLARGLVRTSRRRQVATLVHLFESVRRAGLPHGAATSVLDVGSGSGALVYALGLAGMREVTGIDPFNAGDTTFRTGGRVLRRSLDEVDGTYDLVMLHHSLEHVPDPARTLADVGKVLAPGGRVLVRMPTVDSAAFATYGADWIQLDAPRHLTVFSRGAVAALAGRTGFRVQAAYDDSSSFQFWGSEQAAHGTAMVAADSHFVSPRRSRFSAGQIRAWERRSAELNASARGDQAVWILERA